MTVILAMTLVLGILAGQQSTDTSLESFAPDSELYDRYLTLQDEFGIGGQAIQIIIDGGAGGDVLTADGLETAREVEKIVLETPGIDNVIAPGTATSPAVVSYAAPFDGAMAQFGIDPTAADPGSVDRVVAGVLADSQYGAQAGALLSGDLDTASGVARGGLVIVQLDADADPALIAEVSVALSEAIGDMEFDSFSVLPYSEDILAEQLLDSMNSEMPLLLGLALLLIVGILFFVYRRVSDVVIAVLGLLMSILWMYGWGTLLGPDYLGITGSFSQIAIAIPVLLVGLGVDYAIHLTSRYREENAADGDSTRAAATAITTVGGALILATATTVAGFMTNVVSPLPPIKDFGIFTAAGVLGAFIVMTVFVPSARLLLDRRRKQLPASGSKHANAALASLMGRVAALSERAPRVTVVVALVIALGAGAAGTQLSTVFSQDDFLPAGSTVETTVASLTDLFGGDLEERTYLLVEGDIASPDVVNAMLSTTEELGAVDGVRVLGDTAQAQSVATVMGRLAATPDLAEQMTAMGWQAGGFSPDADVEAAFALAASVDAGGMSALVAEDGSSAIIAVSTTAGQEGAFALADGLEAAWGSLTSAGANVSVVSDSLIFADTLEQLTASQTRSIYIALLAALVLLVAYFGWKERKPVLGLVTMIPSVMVIALVLGSMWALGMSFNVLTATVASLGIGIGVPFGIHVTYRFLEDRQRSESVDEAVRVTVEHTGTALLGSAATTAAGFGVLGFASLVPLQQFGLITAMTITYSFLAAVLVQPATLKLWAQWKERGELSAAAAAPGEESDLVHV